MYKLDSHLDSPNKISFSNDIVLLFYVYVIKYMYISSITTVNIIIRFFRNLKLYNDFTETNGTASAESQLVEKLQLYGLIPRSLSCPTNKSDCKLSVKTARVIDR